MLVIVRSGDELADRYSYSSRRQSKREALGGNLPPNRYDTGQASCAHIQLTIVGTVGP